MISFWTSLCIVLLSLFNTSILYIFLAHLFFSSGCSRVCCDSKSELTVSHFLKVIASTYPQPSPGLEVFLIIRACKRVWFKHITTQQQWQSLQALPVTLWQQRHSQITRTLIHLWNSHFLWENNLLHPVTSREVNISRSIMEKSFDSKQGGHIGGSWELGVLRVRSKCPQKGCTHRSVRELSGAWDEYIRTFYICFSS
jgi:hypothetical protein